MYKIYGAGNELPCYDTSYFIFSIPFEKIDFLWLVGDFDIPAQNVSFVAKNFQW